MSFSFDGVNDTLTGTFASTYANPVTLACFIKVNHHPSQVDEVMVLGNIAGSNNDRYNLQILITPNQYSARLVDAAGLGSGATIDYSIDGVWAAYVGVYTTDALRDVYVLSPAHTAQDTVNRSPSDTLQFIRLGETLAGGNDYTGKIAEAAIWTKALSLAEVTNYMAGRKASTISPGNLIGYWPLAAAGATQANQGLDADGLLTVTGATFDADHPIITTVAPMAMPRYQFLSA